jgi:hypothetical protein
MGIRYRGTCAGCKSTSSFLIRSEYGGYYCRRCAAGSRPEADRLRAQVDLRDVVIGCVAAAVLALTISIVVAAVCGR